MYAVTGITGQVGGAVAERLLADGRDVRAIVRDEARGAPWRARGCQVAVVSDAADVDALAAALEGTDGVFLMNPPNYDPEPGFPDTWRIAAAFAEALKRSRPGRAVFLSTVGAHVKRFNLLNNGGIIEQALVCTGLPIALLRPAWFMENAAWDLPAAKAGEIESFLHPLDRAIDMVAVRDIGETAADLLGETWDGVRVVELSGPQKVGPREIAAAFGRALGTQVTVRSVPHDTWQERFRREGMAHPEARIAMVDGFNEGWIDFERDGAEHRTGTTSLDDVIATIVANR